MRKSRCFFLFAEECCNELSCLSVTHSEASLESALVPEGNGRKAQTPTLTGLNTAVCDGSRLCKADLAPRCMHILLSQRQSFVTITVQDSK